MCTNSNILLIFICSPHLLTTHSAIIYVYSSVEKGDIWLILELWLLQHPHHVFVIWALDNWYTFMMVTAFYSHMIVLCNLHRQFPITKVNGEARRKLHVTDTLTSCLITTGDWFHNCSQNWCHKSVQSCDVSFYDHIV